MRKQRYKIGIILAIGLIVFMQTREQTLEQVSRNSFGEGQKTETYLVTIDGEVDEEEITIRIPERSYSFEEIQELFEEVIGKLDGVILGENETKDHVTKNIKLPTEISGYPVQIQWEMDRYDIIDMDGTLLQENISENGDMVALRGTLTYEEQEALYVTHLYVMPEEKTETKQWLLKVEEAYLEQEAATKEDETISLPQIVDGKQVTWKQKKDLRGFAILGLGAIFAGLWKFQKKQDEKDAEEKRRLQMTLDYSEIVSKFAMLLGAGMTVKHTWNTIVCGYEEEKQSGKNRFAYEEMCLTNREMQRGIAELEAYERFGRRCGVNVYLKFSMLLSQNLRKGTKGLSELLKMESVQALEQRKALAKKRGEEVSTKLLIPMFIMFAVVLVIVMVPAFLSIQL